VANVYLAVLCYATGQYQTATDRCTLVTRSQDHSQCSSQFVQGNCLPKVDDSIDSALGLVVLYHYVRGTTLILHDRHTQHYISVFTTELFAHYLISKHLLVLKYNIVVDSVANRTAQTLLEELQMYRNRLLESKSLSVSDLLLCKLPNNSHQLHLTGRKIAFSQTAAEVINLLTQSSVEYVINHLMQFHPLMLHRSVNITGLLPLYLYRCRLYDQCFKLCRDNVHTIMHSDIQLSTLHREFIQLMDNSIVSVVGLAIILGRTAGMHVKLAGAMTISQLALTLYLLTESQWKLCSSSTRHTATATFADILDCIANAEKTVSNNNLFDLLILKWTQRKAINYILKLLTNDSFCCKNVSFGFRFFDIIIELFGSLVRGLELKHCTLVHSTLPRTISVQFDSFHANK